MTRPHATTPEQGSFLPVAAGGRQSLGALLGLALRRPGGRRSVSLFTVLLLVAGIGMFAFPAVTDLYGSYQQRQVQDQSTSPQFQTEYLERTARFVERRGDDGLSKRLLVEWRNALEALAFSAADAVLVVDDFAPTSTAGDIDRAHRDADRLLRAQGNRSGRLRG